MSENELPIPNYPEWPRSSIAEVSEFVARGTAPVYVESSDILAIGQRCVTDAGFDRGHARPHDRRRMRGVLVPRPDDVLINSTGTGTIGRSCVFNSPDRFIVDGHVTVVRPREDLADGRWIEALIRSHWGQTFLEGQCYSGSTNQVELSRSRLCMTLVPLPALLEQRRIAEILDTADEAIRSTERLIAKLEQGRRGILHDLLTCGIDETGHVRDTHKPSSQFTDPVLGHYPSGWKLRSFGALARYLNGYAFKPEDWVETGYPIIRIQNLNGSSNFNYYDGPVHPNWLIFPGDLLFAWSGTRDSSFGPTIWRGPQGVLNQHIFKVHENGSIVTRAFLYLLLRYYLEHITASAHGFKDSFVHVKRSELTSVSVAVPPINEQEEILRITESEDHLIAAESFKLQRLRLLKTGLMDDLLTGRVRVGACG